MFNFCEGLLQKHKNKDRIIAQFDESMNIIDFRAIVAIT